MSVPNHVFIDTCIFDAFQYKFDAASLRAFYESIGGRHLVLLWPQPTDIEVRRHISEKARSAASELKSTSEKHFFLRRMSGWPLNAFSKSDIEQKIIDLIEGDLNAFKERFKLVELGCEKVDGRQIMRWYEKRVPPFSEGKKSEFPDAFVIATLHLYHVSTKKYIAVISKDKDFKLACEEYPHLLYFNSLSEYAESFNTFNSRAMKVKASIADWNPRFEELIIDGFCDLGFTLVGELMGQVEESTIEDFHGFEFHVVALGHDAATVSFEGEVSFRSRISGEEYVETYHEDVVFSQPAFHGVVRDYARVSGVMKLVIGEDGGIKELGSLFFDQEQIPLRADYVDLRHTLPT